MTQEFKETCLVEVAPSSVWTQSKESHGSTIAEDQLCTASGIVLSAGQGYILTHGSLLLEFLAKNTEILKRLDKIGHIPSKAFQGLQAVVTLDNAQRLARVHNQEKSSLKSYITKSIFNVTNSCEIDSNQRKCMGKIELIWKAERFSQTIKAFLPNNEWTFLEDSMVNDSKAEPKSKDDTDPEMVAKLLPFFVLIKLENWTNNMNKNKNVCVCDDNINIGESVHMVGTPFGSMSPSVFLNSVSLGIVCNVAGRHQELIVTDARCIPGTEGGPLYSGAATDSSKLLRGVVVSALCWKANEWIGMSLACNIAEVLRSLNRVMHLPEINENITRLKLLPKELMCDSEMRWGAQVDQCTQAVVLVKNGGSWGSGVIVDQQSGLVLTCGHVVSNKNAGLRIRVDYPTLTWYDADVVYATPINETFDIGVLKLRGHKPCDIWPSQLSIAHSVSEGEEAFVVGHAMFAHHLNLAPSMTSGVIAKVIHLQGMPVLLQSTCTVNAGASGGPLISRQGRLVGIVACNAKDTLSGASYPNINLSVPVATIWPVIEQYINKADSTILSTLHIKNKELASLWKMKETNRSFKGPTSKL